MARLRLDPVNAMRVPSGDQRGEYEDRYFLSICCKFRPSVSMVKIPLVFVPSYLPQNSSLPGLVVCALIAAGAQPTVSRRTKVMNIRRISIYPYRLFDSLREYLSLSSQSSNSTCREKVQLVEKLADNSNFKATDAWGSMDR